jgi:hypothetical protein
MQTGSNAHLDGCVPKSRPLSKVYARWAKPRDNAAHLAKTAAARVRPIIHSLRPYTRTPSPPQSPPVPLWSTQDWPLFVQAKLKHSSTGKKRCLAFTGCKRMFKQTLNPLKTLFLFLLQSFTFGSNLSAL